MSLKTKLILGAGVLTAIGIGIGLELHRLHRRILKELVEIRKQGRTLIDAVPAVSYLLSLRGIHHDYRTSRAKFQVVEGYG